jgi:4-hydroxymandelate oxidase
MERSDFLKKTFMAAGGLTAGSSLTAKIQSPIKSFAISENPDIPLDVLNIFDLERLAKERLPVLAYDYYRSGAWDETTLKENREAYEKLKIHYKILVDVEKRDLSTTIFGQHIDFPILVAPTAFHKLAHPDGELATGRAAVKAKTIMTLSSLSTTNIEEVAEATNKTFWFQLYINKQREILLPTKY